jgi:hypothetical protein
MTIFKGFDCMPDSSRYLLTFSVGVNYFLGTVPTLDGFLIKTITV